MGAHASGGGIPASSQSSYSAAASHISGWSVFAGTMLMIAAVLNIIYGVGAISDSTFFVGDAKYIFSDLNTWGWIVALTGGVQVLVAFGVWARNTLAVWAGVFFAGLNAIAQLLMIPAYPVLSLALFTVDLLIIYGLAVHGRDGVEA
jgi:membrane-associated HD superfamily phosphohydrolase